MKAAKFDDFLNLANFFYTSIGIESYGKEPGSTAKSLLGSFVFYAGLINMNCILFGEILYVALALINREHFLEATMAMSYIGFVLVGNFKMIFIYKRKAALTKFIGGLQQIFPTSPELQKKYNLPYYLKQCYRTTVSFAGLYMILIWTYNLFTIIQYCIQKFHLNLSQVEQALPYFMYSPWNWRNNWSYYLLYFLQNFAGYTSAAGQISSDLLLTACATQMIMHYDFVAQKLANYRVKGAAKAGFVQDLEFLRKTVQYHTNLLDLSDQLNNIFGVPLLLNFAASSFVICFVGFQITIGATPETIIKLILFLISSITQVYLICHYGQKLMDASGNVAKAVCLQAWFNADTRYMKMLILITERSQKPAMLQATSFILVSRETMTQIMQISYKFFAVLRTMYGKV